MATNKERSRNITPTSSSSASMMGFVLELVLNSGLTEEQRLTALKVELLYRKVKVLCGGLKGNQPTEEDVKIFDTLEECFANELRGWMERWREMSELLRRRNSLFGGGSPKAMSRFFISSSRGVSSGARDRELRYLQEEKECYKEPKKLRDDEMDTLELVARRDLDCAWICGRWEKEVIWLFSADATRRRRMDRGGVG